MRKRLFVGNWKMNKTGAETRAFVDAFTLFAPSFSESVDVAIAPPFTSLGVAQAALEGSTRIALAAQNMHWEDRGAFTGEVSPPMLQEFGVRYVILGHSERRSYFGETDANVNAKVKAALAHGITPVVAVGETLDERNAGQADERVTAQTRAALNDLGATDLARVVLAYEPIWAIGTGRNCDAQEADRVMGVIRASVIGIGDVPVLYGGSMNATNVASYVCLPNIDGGLIGGASLDPTTFATLIANGTQLDSAHA
jgi:triosephosphate isomerase